MGAKIGPSSPELAAFYSARSAWRSRSEERMRFRKASALARVPRGAAGLDIGCRDGGLRAFLPPGVRYQGLDIAFFFFSSRRRHTRCGRDWSSDVCSSDLVPGNPRMLFAGMWQFVRRPWELV